ncbi:MAG: isoleucine--tRNA ligase [Bradymonadia bacterium]
MTIFAPIQLDTPFPTIEREIIDLWARLDAFQKSVDQRPKDSAYVFYDGPPFATGLPHYGHLVASTLKDIVPRYWAMRGHRVERRFGWDTHGLPIEMLMEKKLGLSGPSSVREYGVAEFNEACRANVLKYTEEWRQVITRLGRWVDFDHDYKTMDASFMESVWWVFKQLWDKGLVYQGMRVMPYSWRLSTTLSNFEANMDYRDVQDPAITVRMPLDGDPDNASLLVWTTTPWTLPSNLAVAVGNDITYVRARPKGSDEVVIVAEALVEATLGKEAEVLSSFPGSELVGRGYTPLFPYYADLKEKPQGNGGAFFVIASGHVTTDSGTGLVHMAPAFGEDDYTASTAAGIPVVDPVDEEGKFTAEVPDFAGQNIKEADRGIIRALKDSGRLFKQATIDHSYPFCWRSGTPLIYKAMPVWFVKVTALKDRMVEHNSKIHWVPESVGGGRFHNWLSDARDWNVSRNRFWGTPLPIWKCNDCDHTECIGSIDDLQKASGAEIDDIHPHKIDHLTVPCSACGGEAQRISDVFDCWFESGSMPYAQGHYPFEGAEQFEANFPAEFIAEGLDQTRGWFYTLLVLSTALFDRPPFKNVIVNGMVLAEDGEKMSKSKQNYPPPEEVMESLGSDAIRAYLINSPVVRAEPLKFSERGVREVVRTVLMPLRNAWSFFVQYANIDGWHPGTGFEDVATPDAADRPELDRWILSVMQSLVKEVNAQMEGYYLYQVIPPMLGFIDHLTNWYIRRSRRRFWRSAADQAARVDKASAYATLYEVLVTFGTVMAPVLPFITEALYQSLVVEPGVAAEGKDSIHLCDYPQVDESRIDAALEAAVAVTRQAVGLGRALREHHKLKTRQPLGELTVVHHDQATLAALRTHSELIAEELNVKSVVITDDDAGLATLSFKANFKTLGRRYGKQMKACAQAIGALTRADFEVLQGGGEIDVLGQPITLGDVMVTRAPKGEVVIETEGALTVAVDTHLTPDLIAEGLVREAISKIQRMRKDGGFNVTDRINVALFTDEDALTQALTAHEAYLAKEVLAASVQLGASADASEGSTALELEGHQISVHLEKA